MVIHATGKNRKDGDGWWLCNRKRHGHTSTTYANCKRCLKILRKDKTFVESPTGYGHVWKPQ